MCSVSSTVHLLPFDRLSPADFERLCLWLVRREGYTHVEHLGASGSDKGRDVVAMKDGRRFVFQCKRTGRFHSADIQKEVKKILGLPESEQPNELVFVVTCNVSANARKKARTAAGTIPCHFWAGTELDEQVKRQQDILNEFFQGWRLRSDVPFVVSEDVPHFTGRATELGRIEKLLRGHGERVCGIVGLAGAGGIGKTALAAEFACRHREAFPDGVVTVRVDDKEPRQVVEEVARNCGLRVDPKDTREAPAIMEELFRPRRMLLILDNAVDATVREMLPGSGRCAVVVTTRDRGIAAVLGLNDAATLDVPVLPKDDAVHLLRRWLGDARVENEFRAAERISDLVGHLPLALRIVGATLRIQKWRGLEEYTAALAEERSRLAKLKTEDLDVRASFKMSLRSLDNEDIAFLASLSVCAADGFSVRVARAATGCDDSIVHERLGTLRQYSLLNVSTEGGGWFMFHPLIRLFASELAEENGLKDDAEKRHALFFVEEVKATADADHAVADVPAREIGGVLAAAGWLQRREQLDEEFLKPVQNLLLHYGLWQRAVDIVSAFLDLAERLGDWEPAVQLRIQKAKFYSRLGRFELAAEAFDGIASLTSRIEAADVRKRCEAMCLNTIGGIRRDQGWFADAVDALVQSASIEEELGNQHGQAKVLNSLGGVYQRQGRLPEAVGALEKSHKILVEVEDQHGQAKVLNSLGGVYRRKGRLDEAVDALEKSHKILVEVEDQHGQAKVLNSLGGVYRRKGRLDEAVDALEKSHKILVEVEDQRGQAMVLNSLGGVYLWKGRLDEAVALIKQGLNIGNQLGDRRILAIAHTSLGRTLLKAGQVREAAAELQKGFDIKERLRDRRGLTIITPLLFETLQRLGRYDDAADVCERALAVAPRERNLLRLRDLIPSKALPLNLP